MVRLAKYRQTSVSLKATLDTGLGLLLPQKECALGLTSRQRTLIQIASFLKRELPVRLARRVLELKSGPEGIGSMPAVIRVREWYEQSFEDIRRARVPVDLETEAADDVLARDERVGDHDRWDGHIDEDAWEVERVLKRRRRLGVTEYAEN